MPKIIWRLFHALHLVVLSISIGVIVVSIIFVIITGMGQLVKGADGGAGWVIAASVAYAGLYWSVERDNKKP